MHCNCAPGAAHIQWISIIFSAGTLGILIATWYVAWRSLRNSAYLHTLSMLEGPHNEVRKLRTLLRSLVEKATDDKKEFNVKSLDEYTYEQMHQLARDYDKMGFLVKHRVVKLNFVFDFYSKPILYAWENLSPLVNAERDNRDHREHMLMFETLAVGASLYRKKRYGETKVYKFNSRRFETWQNWRSRNPYRRNKE